MQIAIFMQRAHSTTLSSASKAHRQESPRERERRTNRPMADEQLGLSVVSPVMGVVFFSLYYKAVLEVYKDIRHQPQVISNRVLGKLPPGLGEIGPASWGNYHPALGILAPGLGEITATSTTRLRGRAPDPTPTPTWQGSRGRPERRWFLDKAQLLQLAKLR